MKTRLYEVSSLGIAISLRATVSTTCKLRNSSSVEMLKLMSTLLGIGMKKKWRRTFLYPLNYLKKKLRKKTQVNHLSRTIVTRVYSKTSKIFGGHI